ncbi:hypothetical protein [Streptomyces sp. Isolate_45]|uniref:hypothetical protein n=1 Tax=Streptomyces sp. Isolate_45 TaxID=2950111 RepID=UPI002481F868|nr:hypothetical protein [Streptomyces sp. Isolate_45]MDA5282775.1 hypothetical protein [Streptomyces sp. Isolate_45]
MTARSAIEAFRTPGSVEVVVLLAEIAATHPPTAERAAQQLAATAGERIRHLNHVDAMKCVQYLWQLTSDPRQVVPALIDLVRISPPPGSPRPGPTILAPPCNSSPKSPPPTRRPPPRRCRLCMPSSTRTNVPYVMTIGVPFGTTRPGLRRFEQ